MPQNVSTQPNQTKQNQQQIPCYISHRVEQSKRVHADDIHMYIYVCIHCLCVSTVYARLARTPTALDVNRAAHRLSGTFNPARLSFNFSSFYRSIRSCSARSIFSTFRFFVIFLLYFRFLQHFIHFPWISIENVQWHGSCWVEVEQFFINNIFEQIYLCDENIKKCFLLHHNRGTVCVCLRHIDLWMFKALNKFNGISWIVATSKNLKQETKKIIAEKRANPIVVKKTHIPELKIRKVLNLVH